MAGRVSPSDVTQNFDTSLDDSQIQGWIDAATELVDDVAAADSTVSDSRLKQIERALSRHFAHAQDPRVSSSQIGDSRMTVQGSTGLHLDATFYGQQAKMLDPTGTLANSGGPSASISIPDSRGVDEYDDNQL